MDNSDNSLFQEALRSFLKNPEISEFIKSSAIACFGTGDKWNPNGNLMPQFYNLTIGEEIYEVEAFSEQHAWDRALEAYKATKAAEGLTVLVLKSPEFS